MADMLDAPVQVNRTMLETLAAHRATPSLSVYLPTHVRGPEIKQDPIRLSNLAREANARLDQLTESGRNGPEWLRTWWEPVETDIEFWRHQRQGLAFFVNDAGVTWSQLDFEVDELTMVADRFHVRPLVPALDARHPAVLALSLGDVRLFKSTSGGLEKLDYSGPASVESANWFMERTEQLQDRSVGAAGHRFYAHDPSRYDEADRRRFFREVGDAVDEATDLNVLAVGDAPVVAEFERCTDVNLIGSVAASPDGLSPHDIWELAADQVSGLRDDAISDRTESVIDAIGQGEAVMGTTDVLRDAAMGRASHVFVAEDAGIVWGTFSAETFEIERHDAYSPWDIDLVDAAIGAALATGAEVGLVRDLPEGAPVVAIRRY